MKTYQETLEAALAAIEEVAVHPHRIRVNLSHIDIAHAVVSELIGKAQLDKARLKAAQTDKLPDIGCLVALG